MLINCDFINLPCIQYFIEQLPYILSFVHTFTFYLILLFIELPNIHFSISNYKTTTNHAVIFLRGENVVYVFILL